MGVLAQALRLGRVSGISRSSVLPRFSVINTPTVGSISAGITDRYIREKGIDYFENSRRATYAHRGVRNSQPVVHEGVC